MPDTVTHPTPQQLAAYGLGKLPERAAAAVAAHLEVCAACRTAVAGLAPDSFVARVHAAGPPAATPTVMGEPATHAPPPPVPPELANHPRYRIVRELGRGGMGVVYLARQTVMDRPVVIKVINPSLLDRPDALERFRREIEAAAKLSHPNIVTAYDAEQAGDLHILVMEFVEGQSLAQVLQRKGPLPLAHACHYTRQAALGLQHAFERGMVHRDIKPSNLMLTPRGQVKILDFGLAKMVSENRPQSALTALNAYMGTPDYSAPEQATDARSADIRADLYSLGCTLYCLLAGRPPFQEETPVLTILAHLEKAPPPLPELRPDVPAAVWAVVARLLAKAPAQRFQRPVEVAQGLAPFIKPGARGVRLPGVASPPMGTTADLGDVSPPAKKARAAAEPARPAWGKRLAVLGGAAGGVLVPIALLALAVFLAGKKPPLVDDSLLTLTGHTDEVTGVAWSPDSKRLASASTDGTVKVWDAETGQQGLTLRGHTGPVAAVAWSPDGKRLASASADGTVKVWKVFWDARTGQEVLTFRGHTDWVCGVAWSPDGSRLASASADRTVKVWDATTGQVALTLTGHTREVRAVAWSPTGGRLASASWDQTVKVWEANTGQEALTLPGHTGYVRGVAWSPDGSRVASASWDGTVKVWDAQAAQTGQQALTLQGHTGPVWGVAFSPDGRRVASASADRTVKVWDAKTGREALTLVGHTGPVSGLAYSPDGKRLASCSADHTLRIWDPLLITDRTTAETALKLGGRIEVDDGETISEVTQQDKLPPRPFRLHALNLAGQAQVTDADLERLADVKGLRKLTLDRTQVTDAGLKQLRGLTMLQELSLQGLPVTDAGLKHLGGLTGLRKLNLFETKVGDAGLTDLESLTDLRWLSLQRTQVSDAGLVHLKALSRLQTLNLSDQKISDAGLAPLKDLATLEELHLAGTPITGTGLEQLKGLPKLVHLSLHKSQVTDEGLGRLRGWTRLVELDLSLTQVSDRGLEHIQTLSGLQVLKLQETQVTDQGVQRLQMALPMCNIPPLR
jgi:tRNA A-37 threonylcarbamoyl transferase component Bud32